jgi:hypothetical protein
MKKIFLKYYPLTVLILILSACTQTSDFKERGKFTIARINKIDYAPNGDFHSIRYKYIVNDSLYENSYAYSSLNQKLKNKLLYGKFPVIYLPENPARSRILITENNFKTLDLIYPDSLKWVEENR